MDVIDCFPFLLMLLDDDVVEQILLPNYWIPVPLLMYLSFHRHAAVPRVQNAAEVLVPLYSMEDFRRHFVSPNPRLL